MRRILQFLGLVVFVGCHSPPPELARPIPKEQQISSMEATRIGTAAFEKEFGTSINFDVSIGESGDKKSWLIGFFHKGSLAGQRDNGHVVFVRKADGRVTNIVALP